jgi:hypothetical protein
MSVLDDLRAGDYLREVDDLLLPLSWRRRRRVIADLESRLRTSSGDSGLMESSATSYAAAVLSHESRQRVPLPLRPLASCLWPSPREWVAAGVRGTALVITVIFAFGVLGDLAHQLMWGDAALPQILAALRCPVASGAPRSLVAPHGLLPVVLLLGWLGGQFLNGGRLARDARARRHQRPATLLALAWLCCATVWALPVLTR